MMALKLLNVFLFAAVKYFFSFPYALLIGLNFFQAMSVVLVGGISGFFFFYYLSGLMIRFGHSFYGYLCCITPAFAKERLRFFCKLRSGNETKSRFSRKSRWLVKIKKQYGLWGIVIASPVLLSIPVGAFLLKKYYSGTKYAISYMIISIVGWAALFSAIVFIFPGLA